MIFELDEAGSTAGYACSRLTAPGNEYISAEVPYIYDLSYPCTGSDEEAKDFVEQELLTRVAASQRMLDVDASGCISPPIGAPWIAAVRSGEKDQFLPSFDCLKTPEGVPGQCCVVVKGSMTMLPVGPFQLDDLKRMVSEQLDDVTYEGYQTQYLGAEVEIPPESGLDTITPAISQPENPRLQSDNKNMTAMGGFLAGGLIAAVIGMALVLFRKRRRQRYLGDSGAAVSKSMGDEESVQVHVSVMPDEHRPPSLPASRRDEPDLPVRNYEGGIYQNYKFDLADSFKNEITGKYGGSSENNSSSNGPSSMPVVPPYPMEESSDSEVDSWAQTEGTVGSLEERLEEITAEI